MLMGVSWDSRVGTATIDGRAYFIVTTPALCIAAMSIKHYQQANHNRQDFGVPPADPSCPPLRCTRHFRYILNVPAITLHAP